MTALLQLYYGSMEAVCGGSGEQRARLCVPHNTELTNVSHNTELTAWTATTGALRLMHANAAVYLVALWYALLEQ